MLLLLLMATGVMSDVYRLPLTVVPHQYSIKLVPYFEERNFTFDGEVEITVTAVTDSNNITLHYDNLEILETPSVISSDNLQELEVVETRYDDYSDFYTLYLNSSLMKNRNYKIYIKYHGPYGVYDDGFYPCPNDDDTQERWFAVTFFEPTKARKAFPCFDEPALKAKFSIKIARPAEFQSVSNMPRVSVSAPDTNIGGRIWDTFEETPPISTYLVAFLVSDFKNLTTKDGKYTVWALDKVVQRASYSLELTKTVVEFMEEYTGANYTLPKLDSIANPCFQGGGMENWGLIDYQHWEILQNDWPTAFREDFTQDIVVHEVAHMWFGDLVTPTWWNDIWLKEGFARYFEYLVTDQLNPDWRKIEQFVVSVQQYVLIQDERESYPINDGIGDLNDVEFHSIIVYSKGACIARMMEHILTNSTFQKGLRKYFKTFAYRSADSDDLFQAMEDAQKEEKILPTDINLKTVMHTWTSQYGFPILHVHKTHGHIHITQKPFLKDGDSESNEKKLWWIPISYTTSTNIDFRNTQPRVWMRGESSIELYENLTDSHWIILNIQAAGFFRVNYDLHIWSVIIDYLNSGDFGHIHPVNRAQLLDDAFFFVNYRLLNITTFLDLSVYLIQEADYIPWSSFFIIISRIDQDLIGSDIYDSFRRYVLVLMKKLYDSINYEEQSTDTVIMRMARFNVLYWACYLGYRDCVRWAAGHYTAWLQDTTNTTLTLDLKGIVYCTALSYDRAVDWQVLWEVFVSHNMSTELLYTVDNFNCTDKYKEMAQQYMNLTIDQIPQHLRQIQSSSLSIRSGMKTIRPKMFNRQLNYTHSISGNLDADVNLQGRYNTSEDLYPPIPPEIYSTMKLWLVNFERHHTLS